MGGIAGYIEIVLIETRYQITIRSLETLSLALPRSPCSLMSSRIVSLRPVSGRIRMQQQDIMLRQRQSTTPSASGHPHIPLPKASTFLTIHCPHATVFVSTLPILSLSVIPSLHALRPHPRSCLFFVILLLVIMRHHSDCCLRHQV